MKSNLKIVLTSGGTGGHLFPLLSVAAKVKELVGTEATVEFLFMGPSGEMEAEIIGSSGVLIKKVTSGKLRRYFSFHYLIDIFKIPLGVVQALWHLLWYMPDVVFAKGGYASVPVVFAARLYRIPVLIHESDARPGLANRFLGSIASKICVTFDRARIHFPKSKTILTGNPINPNVLGGNAQAGRNFLRMRKEVKPVVLFLGGSQGAQVINERVIENLKDLLKYYQVVHQTGRLNYDWAVEGAERLGYKIEHSDYFPIAFIKDEMKDLLALADVVVSRAGSSSIAEIAATGKPAILVPIRRSANDHQKINAFEISREEGAVVLEEVNFRKSMLLHSLNKISQDENFRNRLKTNISKFYQPDAADRIAKEIIVLAG